MKPSKLDTAAVFERLIEVYREQFTLLIPAALIVFAPVALLDAFVIESGDVWLALLSSLVSLIATFWLGGMVVEAVRDMQDGRRDFTLGGLLASVRPVIGRLVLVGIIAAVGVTLGFIALIVPGLILLTLWAVVVPVVMIERPPGLFDAFGRSRRLVAGNGWRVFGVIVVSILIQLFLSGTLQVILGDSTAGLLISSLLSNTLVGPIVAIALALVYLQLRALHGEEAPPAGVERAEPNPFGS